MNGGADGQQVLVLVEYASAQPVYEIVARRAFVRSHRQGHGGQAYIIALLQPVILLDAPAIDPDLALAQHPVQPCTG